MNTELLLTRVPLGRVSSSVLSIAALSGLMGQCPVNVRRSSPDIGSTAGTRKGTVSSYGILKKEALSLSYALSLPRPSQQVQSFLVPLAFFMFSWRFCFFFCSRSRASIILASFQDSSALAMKSGVRASMMVVRKP